MRHARDPNELFEVLGNELRSVVGDDALACVREFFAGALNDGGDVGFRHGFADFPVDDEAAVAVEKTA